MMTWKYVKHWKPSLTRRDSKLALSIYPSRLSRSPMPSQRDDYHILLAWFPHASQGKFENPSRFLSPIYGNDLSGSVEK